jgi:transcription antitermination protein NusB
MKPAARRKARKFALQAIYQWQLSGNDLTDIEQQFIDDNDFSKVDGDYFRELLYQVVANVEEIDEMIQPKLDRKFSEVNPVEKSVLRLSSYELMKRIDVPYRVVINEALELAKTFGATDGHKYVNGILDKVARETRSAEMNAK